MTRMLVGLIFISLTGTAPHAVPPVGTPSPATNPQASARRALLSAQLQHSRELFSAGDLTAAASLSQQGHLDALAAGEKKLAAQFLSNLGNCRFLQYRHQEALAAYLSARDLAESSGNYSYAGALYLNISSLYSQLGQTDTAVLYAERALARLSGTDRARFLPSLLLHMANLRAEQDRMAESLALFRQGFAAADCAANPGLCALGWDRVGLLYSQREHYAQAERAMLEAYRIRRISGAPGLEISYRDLGKLRLEQGDLDSASVLLDHAVERVARPGGLLPGWSLYYYRGRVRLAQNRLPAALDDLRTAVRLVRVWRRSAPPGDTARIGIENWTDVAGLYATLVETGNQLYFAGGHAALAEETLVAAEENRAASLRALLAVSWDARGRQPPEYWETLRKLEAAEAELLRGQNTGALKRIQQLQGTLMRWEAGAGSNSALEMPDLVARLRGSFGAGEALLSFHLAAPVSYLWAVSHGDFALYRLPPATEIAGLVDRFEKAVRAGSPEVVPAGAGLYHVLFGQLSPAFQQKHHWLLALDSPLFELPFAALTVDTSSGRPVFLIERHSLETTPGAGMLVSAIGQHSRALDGPFVGIADPVYNSADPRWSGRAADHLHLARLAGSAREIEACARAWGGSQPPQLLEGKAASRRQIEAALHFHPAVVHFATHVLHSAQHPRSGLIVLSLTDRGQNEILSAAEIATWRLDGALVSLSGCSSGSADALPGTGLMGLTRAWLAAGAQAVVASRWPALDDSGALFSSFYGHMHRAPRAGAAVALQRAQLDMIRSETWRSNPRYWGAYFVAGK